MVLHGRSLETGLSESGSLDLSMQRIVRADVNPIVSGTQTDEDAVCSGARDFCDGRRVVRGFDTHINDTNSVLHTSTQSPGT